MSFTESNDVKKLKEVLSRGEYEAQLFDYSAFSLVENLKKLTISFHRQIAKEMETYLIKKCENPGDHENIKNLMQKLREEYEICATKHFKEAESKICDIFSIPPYVLLPDDKVQIDQYTEEDVKNVDNEIKALKSRYRRAICLESLLKKEKKTCSDLDRIEKKILELENNIDTFSDIFRHNTMAVTSINNELKDLSFRFSQLTHSPINIKESENIDHEYLLEKLAL